MKLPDRTLHGTPRRFLVALVLPLFAALLSAVVPAVAGTCDCEGQGHTEISGIRTADETLGGDVCVTGNLTLRAKLTLQPGARLEVCPGSSIDVSSNSMGALIADGTSVDPIVFATANAGQPWRRIAFNPPVSPESVLRHVEVSGAGSAGAGSLEGAVQINSAGGDAEAIPVLDQLTIDGSGAYGLVVDMGSTDPTPPAITGLTITGSARAAARVEPQAVGGIGSGLTLTGNTHDRIEVEGRTVTVDMLWRDHDAPYLLLGNMSVRSAAVWTVAPGTEISVCDDCQIQITSNSAGTLIAEGTVAEPIVFQAANPATPWRRLFLQWPASEGTLLRHVVVSGAGSRAGAVEGGLHISELGGHPLAVPVVDHVTVENSGAYGLVVEARDDDPTPPSVSNVTVTGSAAAGVRIDAMALSGLEDLTVAGNASDRIEVEGDTVNRDLVWRHHGVPYEVLGNISVRDHDQAGEPTRMRIEAGTDLLLHPGVDLSIGTLGDANVTLSVNGTEAEPVTFSRLDGASDPWGTLLFDLDSDAAAASTISHAVFEGGGGTYTRGTVDDAHEATLKQLGRGRLTLDHVEVTGSANGAVYVGNGSLTATDGRFADNRFGLSFRSFGLLRRNSIESNTEGGLLNLEADDECIDAIGNFWGSETGPSDGPYDIAGPDACFSTADASGAGDAVSDGVLYRPFFTSDTAELTDQSSISPDPFWVTADGVSQGEVTIVLRDSAGNPIPGKIVELDSTLGTVDQAAGPTDADGRVVAMISSATVGTATLTARNVTDGTDLGALGAVVFWSGSDGLDLVASGGVPYQSPQLVVETPPFEAGFPMVFQVPMKNANPETVDVELTYRVSGFGIGASFQEVGTVSETLDPGEEWDAELLWTPLASGHRCVRVSGTVDTLAGSQRGDINFPHLGLNFDVPDDPCNRLDATKLVPSSGGLGGVGKHMAKSLVQAYLVRECLNTNLNFRSATRGDGADRDYEELVTPPTYTPPPLVAGGDVDEPEATAATAAAQAAADLAALDEARLETARRVRDAGRAGDDVAALRQEEAYIGFQLAYADALDVLANALDGVLEVTRDEGEPDTFIGPNDIAAWVQQLETTGYDQESIDFLLAFGYSQSEIDFLEGLEVARFQEIPQITVSFYEFMTLLGNTAESRATRLRQHYSPPTRGLLADQLPLAPMEVTFEVGHQEATAETVELVVRPVEVPLGWSWSLDQTAPTLDPGETTTVTLSIDPTGSLIRGGRTQLAVEGYLGDGTLVGGVLVEKSFPSLPTLIFEDSFEF